MNSKPLTYDSLKAVILYLEPNTRLLLSSRAPSIRSVEKSVPLIIDELIIANHEIQVNETNYKYGIYQMDRKKKVPYKVTGYVPLSDEWTCDVDDFGIRDFITKAGGMLPGNNGLYETNLFGEYDLQIIPTNEGRLKKLKKRLQVEKERYTQLLNYRPEGENEVESTDIGEFEFACFQQTVPRTFNKQELKLLKNEEMVKEVFESTYEKIKDMENELLPFDNKRRNIRPKFEIHLTKKQEKSEPCVIERINYTGDLHKAEESLREFMFAKRQHVVMAPFT